MSELSKFFHIGLCRSRSGHAHTLGKLESALVEAEPRHCDLTVCKRSLPPCEPQLQKSNKKRKVDAGTDMCNIVCDFYGAIIES